MESRDLSLLLTLDALLQEVNVTLAARRLGLSTPAVSHALARIRARLDDPILVRAGRSMVLTPRAEELRPQVRSLVEDASRVMSAAVPFAPRDLKRTFTIFTTDHVLLVLGPAVDRILREEAPGVCLRFLPSVMEDWIPLRDGVADLSVCILGHFPSEFRTRQLFTDRFVCVVRRNHPGVGRRLTLDRYLALDHIVVSPLGRPSHVAAAADDVLTVSVRAALALAPTLGLRLVEPPLALASYSLNLLWHPRLDNEPANRWLRDVFVRAAKETIPAGRDESGHARRPRAPRRQPARTG
jgi:DNA-binding transcriptional LysR family regulator